MSDRRESNGKAVAPGPRTAPDRPRLRPGAQVFKVTADRVKAHFAELATGEVIRYELPLIGALNFVIHGVIGGGVTRTLALDPHGKSLSSALLEMDIDEAPEIADC